MFQKPGTNRREFLRGVLLGSVGMVCVPSLVLPRLAALSRKALPFVERRTVTMGSPLRVGVFAEKRQEAVDAISLVFEEFYRLDRLLSIYNPRSAISRLNAAAGERPIVIGPETAELLRQAKLQTQLTEGLFDVSVGPLLSLWGFSPGGPRASQVPSDKDIAAALDAVGPDVITIDGTDERAGLLTSRSSVDLGGIGVGYAVDRSIRILRSRGIVSAVINHSGDAYALGHPPEEAGWCFAVPDPGNPPETLFSFQARDTAISTSGSYERFVDFGGKRYGHILHPLTGRPVGDFGSVTVLAPTALRADVLSTALFSSGDLRTWSRLEGEGGHEAYVVRHGEALSRIVHLRADRVEVWKPDRDS